jgi:uncharacterized protein YndB with AHSA1/START domain
MTADHHDLVLERILDAPRELVWKAWTDPEHLRQWWAPKPYQTPETDIDLRPGGHFNTRMTGPDGFDSSGTGCFLEVEPLQKIVWTNVLTTGYRPNQPEDCGGFPFTAIVTFADAGDGRTRYRAVAMHKDAADRDSHEQMGFHEGWGTVAGQLEQVAKALGEKA